MEKLNLRLKWSVTRMSSSLKLVSLALLSVNVSCLPGPDPGTYHFSKTVWTKEKEVPSYDLKQGDISSETSSSGPWPSHTASVLTQMLSVLHFTVRA